MTTRHTLSYADQLFAGNAYYPPYSDDNDNRRGIRLPHLFTHEFGAVDTADADGICVAVTSTAAGALSATGALVSGGVATFDVPRGVALTASADLSGYTIVLAGTDFYGQTQTENVTGPNNTTVNSAKTFETITSVTASGAVSIPLTVGASTVLGLPIKIADKGKMIGAFMDGVSVGGAVVAGLSATIASTATTADVRGTFTPTTAPNGTRMFTVNLIADHTSKEAAFGNAPA